MLTVIVGHRKEEIFFSDGSVMKTYSAFVRRDGKYASVKSLIQQGELREIELYIQRLWLWPKRVRLSPHVMRGIVEFFNRFHMQGDLFFDCYAFANLVRGVKPHLVKDTRCYWKTKEISSTPRAGDTIFLVRKEKWGFQFRHAATCIAPDLYVSVYGAWGDLEFATLEDMKRDFEATTVLLATPRA